VWLRFGEPYHLFEHREGRGKAPMGGIHLLYVTDPEALAMLNGQKISTQST
jgi:hypothetical protein